ncbi:hypothetical protein ACSBR1_040898 [Camellia fascicularis]
MQLMCLEQRICQTAHAGARALHDSETRPKGGLTRLQFFIVVLISSFSYYIVPNYLFPSITALSFVCWIWKDSVTAQQIGSGLHGLGIGSFSLDWSTVVGFLGSPLATPAFAIVNILVGYIAIVYVVIPIAYSSNWFEAKRFSIFSALVFNADGGLYDVSKVLHETTFAFNRHGYESYSKIHLSIFFAFTYALSFATLAATLSHVALFHGRYIFSSILYGVSLSVRQALAHNYNYLTGEFYLQWPWLSSSPYLLSSLLPPPTRICPKSHSEILICGSQQPGLNVITELIIGFMYPGKPLANVTFKTYGYISMTQAIMFLSDFKLGHYMKIPPKSMFVVQWLLNTVENMCDPTKLPSGSLWTCPGDDVFYNASIIWGLVGPLRMFGSRGLYQKMNYFFLIGLLALVLVWIFSCIFPEKKWIQLINAPIMLGAGGNMPLARAVNYVCWLSVGIFFNFVVYRRFKAWWARHNYILSAGLDAGVAFMAILCYFTLQVRDINGIKWWGLDLDDHCPLASCPTAPG